MGRRTAKAEDLSKQVRWNRWRFVIRNPKFQSDLNRLRRDYTDWIDGPPLTVGLWDGEDVVDVEIARKDIDLHGAPFDPHEDEAFLCAWGSFEYKWGIKCPKIWLTNAMPNLGYLTVQEWQGAWGGEPIFSPAVTLVDAGLVDTPPGTLTIRLDLSYPNDALDFYIREQIAKTRAAGNKNKNFPEKKRDRHDKVTQQLEVFDMRMRGESIWQIAKTLRKSQSTIKSMYETARKLIGSIKPKHGRAWYRLHVKTCPTCNAIGEATLQCAIVSQRREKEGKFHRQRDKEIDQFWIPPLPVQSEKSAFAKWESRHPKWDAR